MAVRALGRRPLEADTPTVSLGGCHVPLANPLFQIRSSDLAASRQAQSDQQGREITSATWFVPYFRHLAFGGIYTIFRFISGFAARGVHARIVIYDNPAADHEQLRREILRAFPELASAELSVFDLDRDDVADLPATDIGVCTFWASAYLLLRFNQTRHKYYFIQDYEPLFYLPGSTFALAESTYRFGFEGIVNTPGLLTALSDRHGLNGMSYVPAVDRDLYHPSPERETRERVRIFFYARPGQPRNAFQLGRLTIEQLLSSYRQSIEVVAAGSEWDEAAYGLAGRITNLGLLGNLREVADLYRDCDIGFAYSLSKHPSYQPFEFMASGMATVTNRNEDTLWLLKDGINCLLAEPSPASMAERIGLLVEDPALRRRIAEGGIASVRGDWEPEIETVWQHMLLDTRGQSGGP